MKPPVFDRDLVHSFQEEALLHQNTPVPWGPEPRSCTTLQALVKFPEVIWDTNRYYADLGVPYDATRAQIGKAYQRSSGSRRMTMIVSTLLNPKERRKYDSTPIGEVYADEVVMAAHRARRAREISKMLAECRDEYDRADLEHTIAEVDAKYKHMEQTEMQAEALREFNNWRTRRWPWGWYMLRVLDIGEHGTQRLKAWQEMLLDACAREEVVLPSLAVGFVGGSNSVEVHSLRGDFVVLLNVGIEPTEALAIEVIHRVVTGP